MPTFTGKTFSNFYKNLLGINQSGNTGVDTSTRLVHDGAGQSTSISLSDDVLSVQPITDNTTGTMLVKNQGGSNILTVDTTNSRVLAGASQVAVNTHYKEFGLFDADIQAGYHEPMVCNNMLLGNDDDANLSLDESMFSNGTDPATTLDLSTAGVGKYAVACYWFIVDNITVDVCRFMGSQSNVSDQTLNFHLMQYTLDNTTNFGDLSAGLVIAAGTTDVKLSTMKTGTMSNTSDVDVDAGKIVVCTVENEGANDTTAQVVVKYHIR